MWISDTHCLYYCPYFSFFIYLWSDNHWVAKEPCKKDKIFLVMFYRAYLSSIQKIRYCGLMVEFVVYMVPAIMVSFLFLLSCLFQHIKGSRLIFIWWGFFLVGQGSCFPSCCCMIFINKVYVFEIFYTMIYSSSIYLKRMKDKAVYTFRCRSSELWPITNLILLLYPFSALGCPL